MNRIALLILPLLLSGCILSPDAPRASVQAVPEPGYTPSSLSGEKVLADAEKAAADKRVLVADAAIADAKAIEQKRLDDQAFKVKVEQDRIALDKLQVELVLTQQAATKIVQDIKADNDRQAADLAAQKEKAAQAAIAKKAQDDQTARERETAFVLSGKQNEADQARARESADFMAWIFRMGALCIMSLIVVLGYRLAQSIHEAMIAKSDASKLVGNEYGIFMMGRLADGRPTMTPMYRLSAPIIDNETGEIDEADEPAEPEQIESFTARSTSQIIDVSTGSREYKLASRACRANATELLLAAIGYLDSIGRNGQAAEWLPGCKPMGWNASTHDLYKKPIARYFDSKPGKGSRIIGYPSLSALYTAVKSGNAPVDVYGRDDAGNPIALLP